LNSSRYSRSAATASPGLIWAANENANPFAAAIRAEKSN
jgi:hypothetical protein